MMTPNSTDAFISEIFGQALMDSGCPITIFSGATSTAEHFADTADAIKSIKAIGSTSDVYFHPALRSPGTKKRGSLNDLRHVVGLWADVDLYAPGIHDDERHPKTIEQATEILHRSGVRPTAIWPTGHGVQALWQFAEPWDISSPEAREAMQKLSQAWEYTLAAQADAMGYSYDIGNHDLPRMLRVPGSWNCKKKPLKLAPALIQWEPELRYHAPDDFERLLADESIHPRALRTDLIDKTEREKAVIHEGGEFTIRRDSAEPDKLYRLIVADPEGIGATWEIARRFKSGDDSASAYAMSLASITVAGGWTNQEVVDLVCAFYRRWRAKKDPTYDLARHQRQWFVLLLYHSRRGKISADIDQMEVEEVKTADKSDRVAWLKDRLGVAILRIEQRGRDVAGVDGVQYTVVIELDGKPVPIPLGGLGTLNDRRGLRDAIEAATAHAVVARVEHFSAPAWERTIKPILSRLVVLVEDEGDHDVRESVRAWLSEYLADNPPDARSTIDDARKGRRPYQQEDHLWVHAGQFARHIRDAQGYRSMTMSRLRRDMRLAGMKRRVVSLPGSSRVYWTVELACDTCPMDEIREAT